MIDELTKQRAKDHPIIDLAIYLGLELKGKLCRCTSPDHEDKNPSMSFDVTNNTFKCFSCGIHGDTIELAMQVKNVSFIEAIEYILNEKITQTSSYSKGTLNQAVNSVKSNSSESGEKHSDIYEHFISLLSFPDEKHYLFTDRKISLEVLKKNNIKNIPEPEDRYYYFNKMKELFPEDRFIKSGLFPISKKGYPYFAFFNCCAVIPFYLDGKIVYLQGITKPELLGDSRTPKVFNLTGISKADLYIPKLSGEGSIHLCEGVITALYFNTLNLDSIALLSGASNLKEATELLKPYKDKEFILCPDEDSSGIAVIKNLKLELFKHGFKYNTKYFKATDFGRKLGLNEEKLNKIKDLNDLRPYL